MATRKKSTVDSVLVNVTRNMVDYALQQTSTLCAVALALRDANDDWVLPRVTQKDIRFSDRSTGQRYVIPTPPKVAAFIDKFDSQRESVRPFTFDLDLSQAEVRPMTHQQPSELLAKIERNRKAPQRTSQKKLPPAAFTNTRKREIRPPEVTGL